MTNGNKIIIRLIALIFFIVFISSVFIKMAQISPINFSLKEGELSCETIDECLKKVKDNASNEIIQQLQNKKDENELPRRKRTGYRP